MEYFGVLFHIILFFKVFLFLVGCWRQKKSRFRGQFMGGW